VARDCILQRGIYGVAISGILVPLDGVVISAAILPAVALFARPIDVSEHPFPTIGTNPVL